MSGLQAPPRACSGGEPKRGDDLPYARRVHLLEGAQVQDQALSSLFDLSLNKRFEETRARQDFWTTVALELQDLEVRLFPVRGRLENLDCEPGGPGPFSN